MVQNVDVLIVDDTPADLIVMRQILEEAGYQVRIAQSGSIALRSIQVQTPDLILLDVKLPDIDGQSFDISI